MVNLWRVKGTEMSVKLTIGADEVESAIEDYLTKLFGKPVVWCESSLSKIHITVEDYEDGTDLPEEFEDEW